MGSVKTAARIGRISYLNCVPYYFGLNDVMKTDYEYFENVPAKVNRALRRGEIDIAPVSSLEYLNNQDQYVLLPGVSIGARDFSGSVLLFSKDRVEGLNHEKIALSNESLSSAVLLKILLKFKYKFDNEFKTCPSNVEKMMGGHKASLVIGDQALFHSGKTFFYKYDLSELWWNWTEKPFCFAVWAVRRKFAEKHPDEVAHFHQTLKANVENNLKDIESLIKNALGMDFLNAEFPKVFGYLFNLCYGLDDEMIEGLELYYRLAKRLGVSPKAKPIEYFNV